MKIRKSQVDKRCTPKIKGKPFSSNLIRAKKMRHTKGKWGVMQGINRFLISSNINENNSVCATHGNTKRDKANAKLISEAGTVANETGKTPRKLADENKELLEALKDAIIDVTKRCTDLNMDCTKYSTWQKATTAIQNATK